MIFFFFQAEDGIRDIGVTGVQTCALPIYEDLVGRARAAARMAEEVERLLLRVVAVEAVHPVDAHREQVPGPRLDRGEQDRKSVVSGKSVDLGGRRIIKKNKTSARPSIHTT